MREMLLIMTRVGSAMIVLMIAALEWRGLADYWRGSWRKHLRGTAASMGGGLFDASLTSADVAPETLCCSRPMPNTTRL